MAGRVGATPPLPARTVSLTGTPEYMAPETLLNAPACARVSRGAVATRGAAHYNPF